MSMVDVIATPIDQSPASGVFLPLCDGTPALLLPPILKCYPGRDGKPFLELRWLTRIRQLAFKEYDAIAEKVAVFAVMRIK